jgi:uncharacterized membrane protein
MKKKLSRLLQPSMGGYLMVMIAFAVAAALFQNYILAGVELVVTACILLIYQNNRSKRTKKLQEYIQNHLDELGKPAARLLRFRSWFCVWQMAV